MSVQDVAFLPSGASVFTTFLRMLVEVNALGRPHVLELWLRVSKGMLPVRYFCYNKASFCVSRISWRS